MADVTVVGEEELSLYHALIGHYLALRKTTSSSEQIDSLFSEENDNNGGNENNGE